MIPFLITLAIALAVSAIGFKKYVWFISIGYGFSVAAIAVSLFIMYWGQMDVGLLIICAVLVIYGCRLGGYLAYRELRIHSYNKKMVGEIKDGKDMSFGVRCAIWVSAAILYACQKSGRTVL